MERNFNNEFERFLKENADQYRLYPSSKVWNGIYTALHTRRKWFGLGLILLLITGSLVTILITHSSKEPVVNNNINTQTVSKQQATLSHSEMQPTDRKTSLNRSKNITPNLIAINTHSVATEPDFYRDVFSNFSSVRDNSLVINEEKTNVPIDVNITDELTDQDIANAPQKSFEYPKSLNSPGAFNWTIESVLNNFTRFTKNRRMSLQFNITPTVSYRKLSSNRAFLASAAASNAPTTYAPLYDINSVVTHKPDLGLEFGLVSKYALSKNFKLRAGLQFNINRYDIKAFNSSYEVAKIDLRGSRGVDSFLTITTHRNFNGYKSDWLQNFYFEISMPIGVELNIVGDDRMHFGVAGTIQPTYVLGERAYLLSTDYKNYALVPWLIRRWNMSTGFETFVAYSTGKVKWQVGPQVRYQLLSSFISKYPVKENLFDFGLKVGISLTR